MEKEEHLPAKPEHIPRPTYWPFVLAVSLLFVGWGLISLWIITVAGLIGVAVSITGWIKEMLYEQRSTNREPQELSD